MGDMWIHVDTGEHMWVVSQAIRILGGGAEIRMVTIASFLEIIAKDFRNSAHGMSRA